MRILEPKFEQLNGSGWDPTPIIELDGAAAIAQHSGIPTRLLDFSESPYKAAFFASEPFDKKSTAAIPDNFAVWVLYAPNPLYYPFEPNGDATVMLRVLRSQNPFLHAQDGLFVACNAYGNRYFIENGSWPTYDQVLKGWDVDKYVLPSSEAASVRDRLSEIGVNQVTMRPSYERIAQSVMDELAIS